MESLLLGIFVFLFISNLLVSVSWAYLPRGTRKRNHDRL